MLKKKTKGGKNTMPRMPELSQKELEAKLKWLEVGLDKTWKSIIAIEERQHKILILIAKIIHANSGGIKEEKLKDYEKIIHNKKGVSGVLKAIILFTAVVACLLLFLMCQTIGG